MVSFLKLLAISIFILKCNIVKCWGPEGHYIVACIAEIFLKKLKTNFYEHNDSSFLLTDNLKDIANWADDVRSTSRYRWSYGLHYQSFDYDALAGQCPDRLNITENCENGCISSAIANFSSVLSDSATSLERRREALHFIVHFLGDVHQPLHLLGQARGGNNLQVAVASHESIFPKKINHGKLSINPHMPYNLSGEKQLQTRLHFLWDDVIIQSHLIESKQSILNYVDYIYNSYLTNNHDDCFLMRNCIVNTHLCMTCWMTQTVNLNCHAVFGDFFKKVNVMSGNHVFHLPLSYIESNRGVVERQLFLAGRRLAQLLCEAEMPISNCLMYI